jgi:phosphatidylethanolamine/phosphatidyl-N-methylethanolamine N-methyltransferase
MAPFADKIGWRSVFDVSRVTVCDELELVERKSLRPFGLFTMLRLRKRDSAR